MSDTVNPPQLQDYGALYSLALAFATRDQAYITRIRVEIFRHSGVQAQVQSVAVQQPVVASL